MGRGGRADAATSAAGLVATFTIIAAIGVLVAAVGALMVGRGARARRWLVTTGAGVAAFAAGIWLMIAALALGSADAYQTEAPTWHMVALPVAMAGWSLLAFAACPPPPPHPTVTGRPAADLPRIDLPAGQRAAYTEVSYPSAAAYMIVLLTLVGAAALAAWATLWVAAPLVLTAAVTLVLFSTRLIVDARGLRGGFGPWGWPRVTVPLAEIVSADLTTVRPVEWGGWGYRIRVDGARGLILRRGPGVRLNLSGGRQFVVSVRDPETVAGLINTLVDRIRR